MHTKVRVYVMRRVSWVVEPMAAATSCVQPMGFSRVGIGVFGVAALGFLSVGIAHWGFCDRGIGVYGRRHWCFCGRGIGVYG